MIKIAAMMRTDARSAQQSEPVDGASQALQLGIRSPRSHPAEAMLKPGRELP